jgi:hypothetical protein
MSNILMNKTIKSSKKLEHKIQKIITDFEAKTKTIVLLDIKGNKLKIGLAVNIDKSTL